MPPPTDFADLYPPTTVEARVNELVLLLGMMAYNVLQLIGQESLEGDVIPLRKRATRR
jgi:hypothetical protein